MQKNISSSELLEAFVSGMQNQNNISEKGDNSTLLLSYYQQDSDFINRKQFSQSSSFKTQNFQCCYFTFDFRKG